MPAHVSASAQAAKPWRGASSEIPPNVLSMQYSLLLGYCSSQPCNVSFMPVGNTPRVPFINSDLKPNLSEELLVQWSLCMGDFQQ